MKQLAQKKFVKQEAADPVVGHIITEEQGAGAPEYLTAQRWNPHGTLSRLSRKWMLCGKPRCQHC